MEEVPGSIVTYTEEEINTFKDHIVPENTKKSTPLAFILSRGTYLISIATLNFQCFALDTSFLSVLLPKR